MRRTASLGAVAVVAAGAVVLHLPGSLSGARPGALRVWATAASTDGAPSCPLTDDVTVADDTGSTVVRAQLGPMEVVTASDVVAVCASAPVAVSWPHADSYTVVVDGRVAERWKADRLDAAGWNLDATAPQPPVLATARHEGDGHEADGRTG